MKNLEKYLAEVKKRLPDIKERLNAGADEEQLRRLSLKMGCELPEELISLYQSFDGENLSKAPCFFAGLQFQPIEKILYDLDFFKSAQDELTAMGTRAIREEPMCKLDWVPFAFDGSRAWLVMDLSPAEGGTRGQIITVDYDRDCCYLLADGMDCLLGKMISWFEGGLLAIRSEDAGEPFILEKSGHLFNSLEELTASAEGREESEISLPEGFWQERYKQSSVLVSRLAKEKKMMLKAKEIDCAPFAYMENMKELILHDCHLKNLSAIARMPQLKKLIFVSCTFDGEQLSALAGAPALKELSLNVMSGAGLAGLSGLESLKSLRVRALTDMRIEELSGFTALWELGIENMGLRDATFIGGLKNLKKLDLCGSELMDLDFLKYLTKLTEFTLTKPAEREEGLSAVSGLTKLKEFIYPVRDISIYKGHGTLECVGMDASVTEGFEVFAGSKVESFTLFGNVPDGQPERIKEQMEKYVKIRSWAVRKGQ